MAEWTATCYRSSARQGVMVCWTRARLLVTTRKRDVTTERGKREARVIAQYNTLDSTVNVISEIVPRRTHGGQRSAGHISFSLFPRLLHFG
ncbi:hypothetical protein V1264_009973 [Littorina saxatilis]|uniref:Uncharacterized protein n=1 Tax=Littorina saxatilis TaxID=31220 RepID=A0AAN9ANG3_9CAEN